MERKTDFRVYGRLRGGDRQITILTDEPTKVMDRLHESARYSSHPTTFIKKPLAALSSGLGIAFLWDRLFCPTDGVIPLAAAYIALKLFKVDLHEVWNTLCNAAAKSLNWDMDKIADKALEILPYAVAALIVGRMAQKWREAVKNAKIAATLGESQVNVAVYRPSEKKREIYAKIRTGGCECHDEKGALSDWKCVRRYHEWRERLPKPASSIIAKPRALIGRAY